MGYQGIDKIHPNSRVPHKKPKTGELTKKQKKQHKVFRKKRVKIEHRKLNPLGSQSQLSVSITSKAAEEEDDKGPNLQQDDIFCLIARLPNLATVMIFLNLYTKLLIAQRLPNRALKVATYLLNMSQITSNSFFKSEAYYSLGECEELLLQTERAMVYYAKALQAVWEFDDKPRECLIYDKIGRRGLSRTAPVQDEPDPLVSVLSREILDWNR